jgi:hypothetical protein
MILFSGILLANLTVIGYSLKPTDKICALREIGFHISISLLYSPLLVKTQRIYRIFAAAKSSVRMPPCVSGSSQLTLTATLIFCQVVENFLPTFMVAALSI